MNHAKNMYEYHVWANKVLLERMRELPSHVLKRLKVHTQRLLKHLVTYMSLM